MAAISHILSVEAQNKTRIHLFREGIFLKAYEHSAFLFYTQVKPFRAVSKHYKTVNTNVSLLGFPSSQLESLFPDGNIETVCEGHYAIDVREPFNLEAYYDWVDMVGPPYEFTIDGQVAAMDKLYPNLAKQVAENPLLYTLKPAIPAAAAGATTVSTAVAPIMTDNALAERILAFAIERSSPIDCMMFLSTLQQELRNR